MCQFISWIEKDGKSVFLTGEDIYHTKRGKELQKYRRSTTGLGGHGDIRWYYNFAGGVDKEYVDFSMPDNFPLEIATAIKDDKMRGLGAPRELLTAAALAEYERILAAASTEYQKVQGPAWAEYKKVEGAALAEAEYEKVTAAALAEYEKVEEAAFWDLFAIPEDRSKAWR